MMNGKLNLAICISGGGTTMQAVVRATKDGCLPHVHPALVISSRPDVAGIERARIEGLWNNTEVIIRKNFPTLEAFGEAILHECHLRDVDVIAQCGFLPRMPENVVTAYKGNIFNQHPGPLDGPRPGFGGKGMHGRAVHHAVLHFARHVDRPFPFRTEATVHRVANEVDGGTLLGIHPVRIMHKEDAASLAERVLPHEHELVIQTLLAYSEFGGPMEIHRTEPLIRENELPLLKQAIAAGRSAFPEG